MTVSSALYYPTMRTRIAVLLFLPFAAEYAFAQAGLGSIQGAVRDASGAVVPGAKVTVTHVQTARQYGATGNEAGFYIFPAVQSGDYSIAIEAAGMETFKGCV